MRVGGAHVQRSQKITKNQRHSAQAAPVCKDRDSRVEQRRKLQAAAHWPWERLLLTRAAQRFAMVWECGCGCVDGWVRRCVYLCVCVCVCVCGLVVGCVCGWVVGCVCVLDGCDCSLGRSIVWSIVWLVGRLVGVGYVE